MRTLVFFVFGALCNFVWDKWKDISRRWRAARTRPPAGSQETAEPERPDVPLPIGYKNGWLCIRSSSPQEVMSRLGCEGVKPCTWARGLSEAGEERQVFVSPRLDGFVLVIGLLGLEEKQLNRLAAEFEELQYFGTHRTVEYQSWARYQAGQLERGYAYLGERGEVLWDEGPLTAEEVALGAMKFPRGDAEKDWEHSVPPTEETVLDLAAAWGMDVRFSGRQYPPSLGYLCQLHVT